MPMIPAEAIDCGHLFAETLNMRPRSIIALIILSAKTIAAVPSTTTHTLTRTAPLRNITGAGEDLDHKLQVPDEELTYGCIKFQRALKDRDFYLNSLDLIRQLSLLDIEEFETPKNVRRDDARSVRITIGGGPKGDEPMPRKRMLQIVAGVVDDMTAEYGFNALKCDIFLGEIIQGRVVAHYEVSSPIRDAMALPQNETEIANGLDPQTFSPFGNDPSSVSTDVLPRCQSTFSGANIITIGDFFNIVAVGMLTMSDLPPAETIGKLNFHSPFFKPEVVIRGVQESRTKFYMRPQDVINALWVLILQELLRVDNVRLPYCTVITRVHRIVPGRGETLIGTIAIQQSRRGGRLTPSDDDKTF